MGSTSDDVLCSAFMTPAAFRKLALSMPGATESPHFERISFRVGTKIFATMKPDGSEAMVPVKPLHRCLELINTQPERFFSYGTWTQKLGSLGIHLGKVDAKVLEPLVHEAWSRLQPSERTAPRSPRRAAPRRRPAPK